MQDYNKDEWIANLKVGDMICDCRYEHHKVVKIEYDKQGKAKYLELDDGHSFDAWACCDPAEGHEHWIVYLLRCKKDDSLYCGITNNLNRRLSQHERGVGAKYTKGRGPFKVVWAYRRASKSEALKLEYKIKQLSAEQKRRYKDEEQ